MGNNTQKPGKEIAKIYPTKLVRSKRIKNLLWIYPLSLIIIFNILVLETFHKFKE